MNPTRGRWVGTIYQYRNTPITPGPGDSVTFIAPDGKVTWVALDQTFIIFGGREVPGRDGKGKRVVDVHPYSLDLYAYWKAGHLPEWCTWPSARIETRQ